MHWALQRLAALAVAVVALGCSVGPPTPRGDLVVFVVIDALRPDHLSVFGHERATSPTLDGLAREGLLLSNVVVHAPQTAPSTLSILSSRLPYEHGVQYSATTQSFRGRGEPAAPRVPDEIAMLAEVFRDAGYFTAGVVANPWLRAEYGFARGYQEYREIASRDGAHIQLEAERILTAHAGERLFLYLHYMDVHNPYAGPSRKRAPFGRPARGEFVYRNGLAPDLSAEDLAFGRTLYDERVHYMDGHLAELLSLVDRLGRADELTLVVATDHGDEFHEHGGLGHGTTLYGELLNGFALLWGPGRFPARRVDARVAAIDLLPTLLAGLGLPIPDGVSGRPVAAEPEPRAVISELAERKAVVRGEWKLVVDLKSGAERLYRIGAQGAIETEPVEDAEVAAALRLLLGPALEATPGEAGGAIDPETTERLRALGYLEEAADAR